MNKRLPVLIGAGMLVSLSADAQQTQYANLFEVCTLLQGGIKNKQAVLLAWEIMLLTHMSRTADNIVAYPTDQVQQTARFEAGLRRAIQVDAVVREIIERVY